MVNNNELFNIDDYIDFMNTVYNEHKNLGIMSRKHDKAFRKFIKGLNKMDDENIRYLYDIHIQYMHKRTMEAMFGAFDDIPDDHSDNEKEESLKNAAKSYINNQERDRYISNNKSRNMLSSNKPFSYDDYNWVETGEFRMHISNKDGMIIINPELWQFLVDTLIHEMYSMTPLLVPRIDPPDKIVLNMGYKSSDEIVIMFDKGYHSSMKLIFHAKTNNNGEVYGELDPKCAMKFLIETSFNIKGDYVFKNCPQMGVVIGTKDTSPIEYNA